jgi:hypothetical protein
MTGRYANTQRHGCVKTPGKSDRQRAIARFANIRVQATAKIRAAALGDER